VSLTEQDMLRCLMQGRTRLSAAAWLVVRDTHGAEDIFQNVTLKAMDGRTPFASEAALMSWAFITARHEAIDWMRRRQRETVGLAPEVLDLLDREWQSAAPASNGRLDVLQDCVEKLPEAARQLLRLRYHDGHSCEGVAERLHTGLDAVYQRLSRLHRSLRQCVEGKVAGAGGDSP
jgi:RNA polymerase sigma-70 factor (ECF subfamily)